MTQPKTASKFTSGPWRSVITSAYQDGFRDGMGLFAWWKDGVQQVGTTGTTFKQAIALIPTEVDCNPYLTEAAKQEINAHPKVEELVKAAKAVHAFLWKERGQTVGMVDIKLSAALKRAIHEVEASLEVAPSS